MCYILWKTALIYLLIQRTRFVNGRSNSTNLTSLNPTKIPSVSLVSPSIPSARSTPEAMPTATKTTSSILISINATSKINVTSNVTRITASLISSPNVTLRSNISKITSYSIMLTKSSNFTNTVISITPTSVVSSVMTPVSTTVRPTGGDNDDAEPKLSLYIWEIVAIAAGAFVCLLFLIIGVLCFQIKSLRKKVRSLQSYSIPIKENGLWIDNQDIPLWQKRASTHNVTKNAGSQESEAT